MWSRICRSAPPRDVPGRPVNPPDPSGRWRHGFSPVLPLAGRKGNPSGDARLSDRPLRHIPRDGPRLPGDLGVDRDEASPVRASDSYGSGVSRPRKPDVKIQKELRQISLEIETLTRPRAEIQCAEFERD